MLAIVVAVHSTTRAPQIVLNKLMVASSMSAADARAAAFAPLHPPTVLAIHAGSLERSVAFAGVTLGQSALYALCDFGELFFTY
jgi:hypothetical protein